MTTFLFATGIENSSPTIRTADGRIIRVDEMEKAGHYDRWREDFELVRELGVPFLRYGPPYYRTHLGPGRYDWSFADETFRALRDMQIAPIADLCHFGVPDWIGDFQNPDWPAFFAEYAKAFAERYPWVRFFTPVNEVFIAALFSARYGWWNERLCTDRGFVTALNNLARASVMAMRSILEVRAAPRFIQSESSEYFHPEDPSCLTLAADLNERRFLSLDLIYGHPVSATMYEFLRDNGMSRADYHWFGKNQVNAYCIMGTDYYDTNEHLVCIDESVKETGEILGYYVLAEQYFRRYRLPVMHTETNIAQPRATWWLRKEWANIIRLREDGIPVVGFTWYSLIDQVDWDTQLRADAGRVNPLGLYDIDRRIRPVGNSYRALIGRWRGNLLIKSLLIDLES